MALEDHSDLISWLPTRRTCSCPKNAMNCLSKGQWLRNQVPIWWFNLRELNIKYDLISRKHHPAIFPTVLVKRIIENYTHAGDTVLDIFSGMGTTLYASRLTKRHGIGIELNHKFTQIINKRMKLKNDNYCNGEQSTHNINREGLHLQQICTDSRKIHEYLPPKSMDLVFTSPPYWDLLKQRPSTRNVNDQKYLKRNYSHDPLDLSNAKSLPTFTKNIKEIFQKVHTVLKPGRRCIINTGDFRRKGQYISLSNLYINTLKELNFELKNVIIWDRKQEYDIGLFSYPYNFIVNNGMFEYLLEFEKKWK
jgi:DNA modification methylase